ncbi:3-oxoacyl-ACP synthase [Salmonella enterica subsp. enterica]|nr:3-oxoacyl-ACP synthase [Salmonella enterica subsp. enterica]
MYTKIIGTGSYLPEQVRTNADLEKMVETSGRVDCHSYRYS